MPISRYRFQDYVSIIQDDSTLDDCNDERDGSNWSSRMSLSRVKHELDDKEVELRWQGNLQELKVGILIATPVDDNDLGHQFWIGKVLDVEMH